MDLLFVTCSQFSNERCVNNSTEALPRKGHTMRPTLHSFVALAFLLPFSTYAQAPEDGLIECDDTNLVPYLTGLIDGLWANGLTRFEELVIKSLDSDEAYNLWETLFYTQEQITMLVPTDDAFGKAGYDVASKSADDAFRTIALHIVEGDQTYRNMPGSPLHSIAATKLKLTQAMTSDAQMEAAQVLVLQQAADGASVAARMTTTNATSWAGPLDMSWTHVSNIIILPVDNIITPPPTLSQALAAASQSGQGGLGLGNLETALTITELSPELEKLTVKGFTIFAPIDSAWDASTQNAAEDNLKALIGKHFAADYTLYSPTFAGDGAGEVPFEFTTQSGEKLSIAHDGESKISTVSLGGVTARILRSDVTLQNGVLHVIDKVFTTSAPDNTTSKSASTVDSKHNATVSGSAKPSSTGIINATNAASDPESSASVGIAITSLSVQLSLGLASAITALALCAL